MSCQFLVNHNHLVWSGLVDSLLQSLPLFCKVKRVLSLLLITLLAPFSLIRNPASGLSFDLSLSLDLSTSLSLDLSRPLSISPSTSLSIPPSVPLPGKFEFSENFQKNASQLPQFPQIVNMTEAGDYLVPVRSSLRGWEDWRVPMQGVRHLHASASRCTHPLSLTPHPLSLTHSFTHSHSLLTHSHSLLHSLNQAEKTLFYKGYQNQLHGYCLIPQDNDPCWFEVLK